MLPGFLFMQGESDGLAQGLGLKIGGGNGSAIPFEPDDSCDSEVTSVRCLLLHGSAASEIWLCCRFLLVQAKTCAHRSFLTSNWIRGGVSDNQQICPLF